MSAANLHESGDIHNACEERVGSESKTPEMWCPQYAPHAAHEWKQGSGLTGRKRWCPGVPMSQEQTFTARGVAALSRFIDAVSPFVRDVLDEPFPWKHGGQVTVTMTREEYDEAVAALEELRD